MNMVAVVPLSQAQVNVLLAFFSIVLSVYTKSMFPSVGGGDSGEIIATACTQAPSHPPGYPLLLMLNGVWLKVSAMLFPSRSPAFHANLFNAILGAVSASTVLLLSVTLAATQNAREGSKSGAIQASEDHDRMATGMERPFTPVARAMKGKKKKKQQKPPPQSIPKGEKITKFFSPPPAPLEPLPDHEFFACVAFSALFAFSKGIWEYCTQAEVFPLNNFLCSVLLILTLLYLHFPSSDDGTLTTNHKKLSVWGGAVCGLAICNQHTSSIYIIVCVFAVMSGHDTALLTREIPTLVLTGLATIAGLSPYLYLVVRANAHAADGWGDQRTFSGFLTHFLRREYGTFVLASEWESGEEQDGSKFIRRCKLFLSTFSSESMHLGLPMLLAFLFFANKHRNFPGLTIFTAYASYSLFFNYLANLTFSLLHLNILGRMWQQSSVAGFALAGAGLCRVMKSVSRPGLLSVFAVGLSLAQLGLNYGDMDRSHVMVFSTYAKNVLENLPPNATLMTNDDMNCNTLHYMVRCENLRPDVNVLKIPLITYEWWKPMQLEHFPNVKETFPGTRHHPYDANGFNMKQFLDINVKPGRRPNLYVLGDWKNGDDSQDVYKRLPVGLADLVVRPGDDVPMLDFAKELEGNLKEFDESETIGEVIGSWENVMKVKFQNFFLKASHHIAMGVQNLNSEGGEYAISRSEHIYIAELGLRAYQLLRAVSNVDSPQSHLWLQRSAWRNAGVVAGLLGSLYLKEDQEQKSLEVAQTMFRFWEVLIAQCKVEKGMAERDCKEISLFLDHRVNPYSQQKFMTIQGFEWLEQFQGLYEG